MHHCKVEFCKDKIRCRGLCSKHYRRWGFFSTGKVNKNPGYIPDPVIAYLPVKEKLLRLISIDPKKSCWNFKYVDKVTGYGRSWFGNVSNQAHRVFYEAFRGPLTDGLVIDHLCRNRACCNPDHMEEVTQRENTLRGVAPSSTNAKKIVCNNGHILEGENLRIEKTKNGFGRRCKTCKNINSARRYKELKNEGNKK